MRNPKLDEIERHIGEQCVLNGAGDLAMVGELRVFIRERTLLTIERVTKGGKVIVRLGKKTYSVPPKNIDILVEEQAVMEEL